MKITDEEVLRSFLAAGWRLYWHSSNLRWYIYTKNDQNIIDSSLNAVCEKLHEEQKKAQANIIRQARARDAEMASALRSESSAVTCEQGAIPLQAGGLPDDPAPTCKGEIGCPDDPPEEPEHESTEEDKRNAALFVIGVGTVGTSPYWGPPVIKAIQENLTPWWQQNVDPWFQQSISQLMKSLGLAAQAPVPTMMGNVGQAFAPGPKRYTVSG